jgi:hypothetical protein
MCAAGSERAEPAERVERVERVERGSGGSGRRGGAAGAESPGQRAAAGSGTGPTAAASVPRIIHSTPASTAPASPPTRNAAGGP